MPVHGPELNGCREPEILAGAAFSNHLQGREEGLHLRHGRLLLELIHYVELRQRFVRQQDVETHSFLEDLYGALTLQGCKREYERPRVRLLRAA